MVGYALSAASDESCEDILITVFDADDFTFAGDGSCRAIYRYSRRGRVAERIDAPLLSSERIPYDVIYEVANLIKNEERKWQFPMALVWSRPEFGQLELVSAEFQSVWPAVMFMRGSMECTFVNITDVFFPKGIRPLHASFLCDVLNSLVFRMGIYINEPFCSCFGSVFCDARIIGIMRKLFGNAFFDDKALNKCISAIKIPRECRISVSKRSVAKNIRSCQIEDVFTDAKSMHTELVAIKRKCFAGCMDAVLSCIQKSPAKTDIFDLIKECISGAIEEIVSMTPWLLHKCIISVRTDIHYLTYNDLNCAFAFADDRMDLKTVIRMIRRKNAVAGKNKTPTAVTADGRFIY